MQRAILHWEETALEKAKTFSGGKDIKSLLLHFLVFAVWRRSSAALAIYETRDIVWRFQVSEFARGIA